MRVRGEKWKNVDELYGESFRKDLSKGRRYHSRYQVWLSVFKSLEENKRLNTN